MESEINLSWFQIYRKNRNVSSNIKYFFCFVYFTDEVLVDKIGKIITIGINRPQKRNCVNLSVAQKLRMAMRDFENDENANVAVLYGTGGNFCAGYDLTQFTNGETNLEDLINPKEGPMVCVILINY